MGRSLDFYDRVLSALGVQRASFFEDRGLWLAGYGDGEVPFFWIGAAPTLDPLEPTEFPLAPVDVLLHVESPGQIDAFYEAAISAGAPWASNPAACTERPGIYQVRIVDPNGHRIEAVAPLHH